MDKDINIVELIMLDNPLEIGSICAMLEKYNIPFYLKEKGSGEYMRILSGGSVFGTRIMIAEHDLELANEIIEVMFSKEKQIEDELG